MEYLSLEQCALKVLRLSNKMLSLARQNEWQTMAGLEKERQSGIEALFRHPAMPGAINEITEILQQILEMDRQSLELGNQARAELVQVLNQQTQGQRALKAYAVNV